MQGIKKMIDYEKRTRQIEEIKSLPRILEEKIRNMILSGKEIEFMNEFSKDLLGKILENQQLENYFEDYTSCLKDIGDKSYSKFLAIQNVIGQINMQYIKLPKQNKKKIIEDYVLDHEQREILHHVVRFEEEIRYLHDFSKYYRDELLSEEEYDNHFSKYLSFLEKGEDEYESRIQALAYTVNMISEKYSP